MTLLLGFAAVNTGNNLLYLLVSALLGFMAVSGVLGHQNLQRLEVRFRPGYELFAATDSILDIELHNRRRWLPAFLLRLEIAEAAVLFPLLATGQKAQQRLSLRMPQRGLQPAPPIRLTSCFPINFFVRSRTLNSAQQLLVFPQPLPCALSAGAEDSYQNRQDDLPLPGGDGEIRAIDDYRPGDPLKAIHWKLSARHRGFKSKRLNQLGSSSLVLDLQLLPGSREEQLSRCTYLVNRYSQQQRPVGLRFNQQLLPPAVGGVQRQKLLAALALYAER